MRKNGGFWPLPPTSVLNWEGERGRVIMAPPAAAATFGRPVG